MGDSWRRANRRHLGRPTGPNTQFIPLLLRHPADGQLVHAIERAQDRMRLLIEASPRSARRSEALAQHRREHCWLRTHATTLLG